MAIALLNNFRTPLMWIARAILRQSRLRTLVLTALDRVPMLRTGLRKIMQGDAWRPPRRFHTPRTAQDLSPATLAAYRELAAAFNRMQP